MEATVNDSAPPLGVVRWVGELDLATAAELYLGSSLVLAGDADELVLDLSSVTFLDSTILGVLVRLRQQAARFNKPMTLVGVPARVGSILHMSGLAGVFDVQNQVSLTPSDPTIT